ncbi:MAG: AbrB/MazE/SpoVT family DNA-binding domain-containing protein [Patescibacteria group bacterium]
MFPKDDIIMYGTGTIGEKGQIVIPAKARKKMKVKAGDNFIFFGHGPLIHMVKADQLNTIINTMTNRFTSKINSIKAAR